MILIQQEYNTSCGIACVAMLAGKSHNTVMRKAIELFEWKSDSKFLDNNSRTSSKKLIRLLSKFGLKGKLKKFKSWDNLEGKNILAVRYNENTGNWHWVVVERKNSKIVILNPEADDPLILSKGEKTDGRTYGRVKFYLKIE